MNITDVIKKADPKKEFVSIEKGDVNLVMVFDHEALVKKDERKIVRLYKLLDDEETVEEINTKTVIEHLVKAVENNIDVGDLLREVFSSTPPDLLLKIYTDLVENEELEVEASAEPAYHCCYSMIFGDKDSPDKIEIPIFGGRYDRSRGV